MTAAGASWSPPIQAGGRAGRLGLLVRLVRRPEGAFGVLILTIFGALAIAPDFFVGPLQTAVTAHGTRLSPPSAAFPLGTDELRRDILNLTVHGARVSMAIGLLATLVTVFIGAVVGIVSGFVGGRVDAVLMRITDFFLVIPTFVLALILTPIIRDLVGSASTEGCHVTESPGTHQLRRRRAGGEAGLPGHRGGGPAARLLLLDPGAPRRLPPAPRWTARA